MRLAVKSGAFFFDWEQKKEQKRKRTKKTKKKKEKSLHP